jgi:hypothetical protein
MLLRRRSWPMPLRRLHRLWRMFPRVLGRDILGLLDIGIRSARDGFGIADTGPGRTLNEATGSRRGMSATDIILGTGGARVRAASPSLLSLGWPPH